MYIRDHYIKCLSMMVVLSLATMFSLAEVPGDNEETQPPEIPEYTTQIEVEPENSDSDTTGTGSSSGGGSSQGSPTPGSGGGDDDDGGGGKRAFHRDDLRFGGGPATATDALVYDRIETLWGSVLEAVTIDQPAMLDDGSTVMVPRGSIELRDLEGGLIWRLGIDGPGQAVPHRLLLDDDLAVVAGTYSGTIRLGGRELNTTGRSAFIAALDLTGEILWVNEIGGHGWTEITTLEYDNHGSIRVWGNYRSLTGQPTGPTFFRAGFSQAGHLIDRSLEEN